MRLHTKGSEDSLLLKKTGPLEIGGQKGPSPPSDFEQEQKQNCLLQKASNYYLPSLPPALPPRFSDLPTDLLVVAHTHNLFFFMNWFRSPRQHLNYRCQLDCQVSYMKRFRMDKKSFRHFQKYTVASFLLTLWFIKLDVPSFF